MYFTDNVMIWAVLIFGILVQIQAADNDASTELLALRAHVRAHVNDEGSVADMGIPSLRDKRFIDSNCTLSTFKTFCKFTCKEMGQYIVCFTVKLDAVIPETAAVEIEGNVNGLLLFAERLGRQSDPHPTPKCSTPVACMFLKNVNPSELSACIELFDLKTNKTHLIGCFSTTLFGQTTVILSSGADSTPRSISTESGNTGSTSTVELSSQGSTSGSTNVTIASTIEPNGDDVNGSSRIGTIPTLLLSGLAVFADAYWGL